MYCHHCGVPIGEGHIYCASCGAQLRTQSPLPAVTPSRFERHRQLLGFLWLAAGVIRLMGAGWLFLVSRFNFGALHLPLFMDWGFRDFFFGLSALLIASAILAFITGYGVLEREPWARPLGIVMAILALIKIPLGTILGIYTLWVLLPAESRNGAPHRATQAV